MFFLIGNYNVYCYTSHIKVLHFKQIYLLFCLDHGFSVRDISNMTGFSERTIWRRLKDLHFSIRKEKYSGISDDELLHLISTMIKENPKLGNVYVLVLNCICYPHDCLIGLVSLHGRLQSEHDTYVQRARIESSHRVTTNNAGQKFHRRRLK